MIITTSPTLTLGPLDLRVVWRYRIMARCFRRLSNLCLRRVESSCLALNIATGTARFYFVLPINKCIE